MSTADRPGLASARRRSWRQHPCLTPLVVWCVVLVAAVSVAVSGPIWLGIVLGLPAALYVLILAASIADGVPITDRLLSRRLEDMLIDVGGADVFGVVVQDNAPFPSTLRRRRQRPVVIAASDFLTDVSDELLRGVAALQHAEIRDPRLTRLYRIGQALTLAAGLGMAAAAAALTTRSEQPTAIIASFALSTWLSALLRNALLKPGAAQRLHDSDLTAAVLAGNNTPVVHALQAAASWRTGYHTNLSRLARILRRCIQPISPHFDENQRALALNDANPSGR